MSYCDESVVFRKMEPDRTAVESSFSGRMGQKYLITFLGCCNTENSKKIVWFFLLERQCLLNAKKTFG